MTVEERLDRLDRMVALLAEHTVPADHDANVATVGDGGVWPPHIAEIRTLVQELRSQPR